MAIDPTGGKKSPRTAIALAVLGVLGLGIIYWQFLYSPLDEERQKKRATHRKLDKENRDLKEEARIQSAMLECKPELDALNKQNELMLPSQAEAVAFMKVLTNTAGNAGLAQGPTKKLPEANVAAPPAAAKPKKAKAKEPAKGKAKKDPAVKLSEDEMKDLPCWERVPGLKADESSKATFVRVPFEIEVRGTFHQLIKYFWKLHEHAKTGRIITVENLTLENAKATSDGMVLTAKFIAVGFREGDRPTATAGGDDGGAKGGKAVVRDAAAARGAQADAASEGAATPPPPANPAAAGADRMSNPGAQ
jgi:Tfp pilus assembly protein PilO